MALNRLVFSILLAVFLASCTAGPANSDPIPVHSEFSIQSTVLGEERVTNVYTPPTYDDGQAALPVVYMPDGGIEEDFPHIANTIAALIERGDIPPVILVGIENTERGRDLTPDSTTDFDRDYAPQTDGASKFRAFIRDELMPEIESRYRTTAERTIIGESSAGLFVMDTFFREPDLFDHYIAMDPALWWDDHALVRRASEAMQTISGEKSLWFAGSDAEDIFTHTRELASILDDRAPDNLRWTYTDRPEEQHSTIFRATKEEALIWSLGENRLNN
ncbi:alpha/beta hydrolase [Aurantiacibacter zhengii]|uniref:Alpha/beta hydrolase n=1 Tax=Aurantiacibacter zhengii TaxID=2307003 RepID=A0A418NRG1_9SPHN|nr:alpha/beta hydrolase-fold protein [Aurantiacibacter zhengii]RIV85656.1 alpha/beta hydrolase [Aurantiacibacter zhengii]